MAAELIGNSTARRPGIAGREETIGPRRNEQSNLRNWFGFIRDVMTAGRMSKLATTKKGRAFLKAMNELEMQIIEQEGSRLLPSRGARTDMSALIRGFKREGADPERLREALMAYPERRPQ